MTTASGRVLLHVLGHKSDPGRRIALVAEGIDFDQRFENVEQRACGGTCTAGRWPGEERICRHPGRPGLANSHRTESPFAVHREGFSTPSVMGWTAPDGIDCARMRSLQILKQRGPSVEQISRIGMDTSKHFFQLHGVNVAEKVVLRKKLRRKEMVVFFEALAPTVIGIEACGASHHWARILRSFGHEVKLIAPQLVKPYVKRGKNDTADAEALCEAMS